MAAALNMQLNALLDVISGDLVVIYLFEEFRLARCLFANLAFHGLVVK